MVAIGALSPEYIFTWSSKLLVETICKLTLSVFCSVIISIERELHTHPAGMGTHSLVGLGSCLFTMISVYMRERYPAANADPARICAQIVNGIGFLGSATVFKSNNYVKGINTAANLWICAAISMAIGAGLWEMALVTALFTAGVLALNNCYKRRLYLRMQEEQNELNAQQDLENPTEGKSRNNSNVYNSQYVDLESVGTGFDAMMGSSGTQERDGRQDRFVEMARLNKLVSNLVLAQELTKTENGNSGFETVSQGGLIDGSHEKTV